MSISLNENKRIKQRFDVDLKAELTLAGEKVIEQQCRLVNLSASGARLQISATAAIEVGASISLKIAIPETIMHAPTAGEVVWTMKQHKGIKAGIKFKEVFSEIMMKELTKNGCPEKPYKPQ